MSHSAPGASIKVRGNKGSSIVARGFEVRVATPSDKTVVSKLLLDSYPTLMAAAYDTTLLNAAVPLMAQANPAFLRCGTYYVAEDDSGSLIGCGGWTRERPGDGNIKAELGHIRHFGVHPNATRRGVGRAIYERCEVTAREANIRRFECYASLNAKAFYAALGFEPVSPMDVAMGPTLKLPAMKMIKTI